MFGPKCVGAASFVAIAGAIIGFAGLFLAPTKAQTGPVSPTFVASQANAGMSLYQQQCSSCHGANLTCQEVNMLLTLDYARSCN